MLLTTQIRAQAKRWWKRQVWRSAQGEVAELLSEELRATRGQAQRLPAQDSRLHCGWGCGIEPSLSNLSSESNEMPAPPAGRL